MPREPNETMKAEEKRQTARGKTRKKKRKPLRNGRLSTADKLALAQREENVFPSCERRCGGVHELQQSPEVLGPLDSQSDQVDFAGSRQRGVSIVCRRLVVHIMTTSDISDSLLLLVTIPTSTIVLRTRAFFE